MRKARPDASGSAGGERPSRAAADNRGRATARLNVTRRGPAKAAETANAEAIADVLPPQRNLLGWKAQIGTAASPAGPYVDGLPVRRSIRRGAEASWVSRLPVCWAYAHRPRTGQEIVTAGVGTPPPASRRRSFQHVRGSKSTIERAQDEIARVLPACSRGSLRSKSQPRDRGRRDLGFGAGSL